MSLSSTVQNLLNKDQDAKAVASDRDAVIETWNGDIEAVFQSFRSALEDFVAAGTAAITEEGIEVAEETLGQYQTQRLVISIVGRNIVLSPIARLTIGGTGRIDLYREDRLAEDRRIFLVRGSVDASYDPKTWLIEDRRDRKTDLADKISNFPSIVRGRRQYTSLDKNTIQEAIDYLLTMA